MVKKMTATERIWQITNISNSNSNLEVMSSPNALQSCFFFYLFKIEPFRKKLNQPLTKRLGSHYMASHLQSGSSAKTKINMTETDTDRREQRHSAF